MTRSKRGGAGRKASRKADAEPSPKDATSRSRRRGAGRKTSRQPEAEPDRDAAESKRGGRKAKASRKTDDQPGRDATDPKRDGRKAKASRKADDKPDRGAADAGPKRGGRKAKASRKADDRPGRGAADAGPKRGGRKAKASRKTDDQPDRDAADAGSERGGRRRKTARKADSEPRRERAVSERGGRKAEPSRDAASRRSEPPERGAAARSATLVRGTYGGHPRGFGFLTPERGGPDLFVPPQHEGAALDGDTVEAEPGENGTARVTAVVRRGRKLIVGTYLGNGLFDADAHRIARPLSVEGEAERGDKVLVGAVKGKAKLAIRKVLGRAGDADVEDAATLAELGITPRWPKPVTAEARALPAPSRRDDEGRLDLRKAATVVTIDPVTSRDFDDAVSLERRGEDWLLGVHIADVSHYVTPGTALDREALRRGTSVYLPGRVIPMLPERLSNDLCSLREGVDRLAMSVLMRYDPEGRLRETTFAQTVIHSDRRFSYERASRVMDGAAKERGGVGKLLLDMARLARTLRKNRPSFDLPRQELELVYGGRGEVVDLHPTADDVAHGVIEEFMLAANREVARLLLRKGVASIYRHHPEPEDLTPVWADLARLGCPRAEQQGLSKAMAAAARKGYGPAATAAVLRSMPRAIYATEQTTHFSLGFEAYTHFTSPIRRYADLVVHRQLRGLLDAAGGPVKVRPARRLPEPTPDRAMEKVAQHATEQALGAERAESRIRRHRLLEFIDAQQPARLTGQVTMVVERGLSVDLPRYGTWGFAPSDGLPGGPHRFEPGVLRGKSRTFALGDTIDVEIARIDAAANELELRPV